MKLIGLSIVVVFATLIVGASGARWIGQQRQTAPAFPLPDDKGCWDGLCFSSMPPEDVLTALGMSPRVIPGSAAIVEGLQPGGYDPLIAFTLAARPYQSLPVLLYWAAHSYYLTRDWRTDSNPALLRVGDILSVLGPPDRVSLLTDQITLHYGARRLEALVVPSGIEPDQARIYPEDAVIGLFVIPADSPQAAESVYYPPSSPWRGFGTVQFRTLP